MSLANIGYYRYRGAGDRESRHPVQRNLEEGAMDKRVDRDPGALQDEAMDDLDLLVADEDSAFHEGMADIARRGEILRALIARRKRTPGLTQKIVASAMGTTQSAVSELECGVTDPYLSTLQRYARAVGTRLALGLEPISLEDDAASPRR